MNSSTLVGLGAAFLVAVITVLLSADNPAMFINLPGLLIVIGGTAAATFISYPLVELGLLPRALRDLLRERDPDAGQEIETLVDIAWLLARRKLPAIEDRIDRSDNPFLRTGLQMVIDGVHVGEIREVLHWRMTKLRQLELGTAQIFRSMAVFAPAFGMVGTLLGLINLLQVLDDQGTAMIGGHLALALMTTLYGMVLANLVCKPLAIKLERRTERRLMLMNLLQEGMVLLAEGRTPAFIRETMKSFATEHRDEMFDGMSAPVAPRPGPPPEKPVNPPVPADAEGGGL